MCVCVSFLAPQNLDVTVTLYNKVRTSVLEVEHALIETQLADLDQQLERAMGELNWTSDGIPSTVNNNALL